MKKPVSDFDKESICPSVSYISDLEHLMNVEILKSIQTISKSKKDGTILGTLQTVRCSGPGSGNGSMVFLHKSATEQPTKDIII